MKILLLAVATRWICVAVAFIAAVDPAIAADEEQSWPEGSAMAVGGKLAQTRDYFERLLNREASKLIQLLSEEKQPDTRLIRAVQAQHQTWIKYRNDECELIGSLSGAGGTWPSTYAVMCQANLTDRRFRSFRWAIKCWRDIPAQDRSFSGNKCLYQLAPLATK